MKDRIMKGAMGTGSQTLKLKVDVLVCLNQNINQYNLNSHKSSLRTTFTVRIVFKVLIINTSFLIDPD